MSGTQSGRQLVTQLGLCSRSGFPVRVETASTCWVFALTSIMLILILAFKKKIYRGTPSNILVMDITEEIREEVTMWGNVK